MKLVEWFIDANIWIALGAIGLSSFTYSFIDKEYDWNVGGFLFFATLLTYNGQALLKWPALKKRGINPKHKSRAISMTIAGFIGLIYFTCFFTIQDLKILLLLSPICFLYAFQFPIKSKKSFNLRNIPFIKIYLIAIVWVLSCLVFPIYYENIIFQNHHFAIFIAFILYLLGITIPFDIRDIKYDSHDLKTIPQLIGVDKAKATSVGLLLFASGIITYLMLSNQIKIELGTLSIALFLVSIILTVQCNENRKRHYYTGYLDGTMVLFFLSYFL